MARAKAFTVKQICNTCNGSGVYPSDTQFPKGTRMQCGDCKGAGHKVIKGRVFTQQRVIKGMKIVLPPYRLPGTPVAYDDFLVGARPDY